VTDTITHPFSDEPIEEVELQDAPLVKVMAQLRFPMIAAVSEMAGLTHFQRALSHRYPVMREEKQIAAVMTGEGQVIQTGAGTIRRFHGLADGWSVSLAPDWVAIETTEYTVRADFISRWTEVIAALQTLDPSPVVYDRLGVRYVDRLVRAEANEDLSVLVRSEVLGALVLSEGMSGGSELVGVFTQAHFRLDNLQLLARWGRIPASTPVLPGIDPIDEVSWILDIDVFTDASGTPFLVEDVAHASEHAAMHAYRFFRWAMTDEFIHRHGNQS